MLDLNALAWHWMNTGARVNPEFSRCQHCLYNDNCKVRVAVLGRAWHFLWMGL